MSNIKHHLHDIQCKIYVELQVYELNWIGQLYDSEIV